jgi:hypothetical protein
MDASLVAAVGRRAGSGIINESGAIGCFHAPGMCLRARYDRATQIAALAREFSRPAWSSIRAAAWYAQRVLASRAPMPALMVAYTMTSLWIIAKPAVQ